MLMLAYLLSLPYRTALYSTILVESKTVLIVVSLSLRHDRGLDVTFSLPEEAFDSLVLEGVDVDVDVGGYW